MSLLTIKETAEMLRITRISLYRFTSTGELPTIKYGRSVRIRLEDVEAFLHRHTTQHQKGATL